ncbi:MAG: tetratricopeptide repeat protein [Burkholderiales bacterium]|nr:tetratricopeptide repeat protein [Burkholderiales bacterium]
MGLRTMLGRVQERLERRADTLSRSPGMRPAPAGPAGSDADLFPLRRAVALAPEDPRASLALAHGLEQAGRTEEAARAACSAAHLARRRGDAATELEACRAWARLEPSPPEPAIALAAALAAVGHAAQAADAYEGVIAAHGARVDLLIALGSVHEEMARGDDAFRAYTRAVELEPDNADALIYAGVAARDAGRSAEGEALLERALRVVPDSAHALFNLGLLRMDRGGLDAAARDFDTARALRRGEPWSDAVLGQRLATSRCDPRDMDWGCTRFKLEHDIEQLGYLRAAGRIGPGYDAVIAEYRRALGDPALPTDPYSMVPLDPARYPTLAASYKRPLHVPVIAMPEGPLVSDTLHWDDIEARYLDAEPNRVCIDGLLTPAALDAVRTWCLEATVWNDVKVGYLGASMHDGFASPLLLRIAAELRARMPRVIGERPLQTMWGFKYDSQYAGTGVHADEAAVNVNFWITPDEANLDASGGGLIVHSREAPRDWGFRRFNVDVPEIRRYLASVGSESIRVPYRSNRAMLFDSDLFHETDAFRFRPGYENRRINITMLYGTRDR